MIEVTARILRSNTAVFLAGELVECSITFTNPSLPEHKIFQSYSDGLENLAWASAQIHCYCCTDNKVTAKEVGTVTDHRAISCNVTSLEASQKDRGQVVVETKPKILFCDLCLSPGENKTYHFKETIPFEAPPSYRGTAIKYSYKITIGTQRVNSAIKLLSVPIRVLPLSTISGLADAGGLCNDTTEELTRTNPFLETTKTETPLDISLQNLQNITARRSPNFYMITNTKGKVCRFCLFKPAYKLGEDIVGTFDFSIGTVNCAQVSVSLQCEEILPQGEGTQHGKVVTYSRHHEVCLGLTHSQLILPIPVHAPPCFQTKLVQLKWRLHFEFVTSSLPDLCPPETYQSDWQGPAQVPIETMVWDLPVTIHSTCPSLITQPNANSVHVLVMK